VQFRLMRDALMGSQSVHIELSTVSAPFFGRIQTAGGHGRIDHVKNRVSHLQESFIQKRICSPRLSDGLSWPEGGKSDREGLPLAEPSLVLIVEDEIPLTRVTERYLDHEGFEIRVAEK
jgi:hypothetical protein